MDSARLRQQAIDRWAGNRFGMFIHWGLYALAARHEWVKSREEIPDDVYQRYFEHFFPDRYDPREWARAAREAGVRYVVLTTKHHEGFCLWDTAQTDYKVTKTPWGRDLLKPFVEAFREEGLRVGFYYSLLDWHHPDYTTDIHHPSRNDEKVRRADAQRDLPRYAAYIRAQVRELLSNYGDIDMMFYDFSVRDHRTGTAIKGRDVWESEELVKLTRELQPGILINDRLDLLDTDWGWDFRTPEQVLLREPPKKDGKPVLWETCQTFSGSWGYHRDESTWKTVEQLVKLLVDTVSKGGNLLLNVGPTARGDLDARAVERLAGVGEWMRFHDRSIYGCTFAPEGLFPPADCRLTYNPVTNRMYVHVFSWPPTGEIYLDGFADRTRYAQLLNDASELRIGAREDWQWGEDGRNTLSLKLPVRKPDVAVPVIELYLA